MSSLKEILKEAQKLLKEQQNENVINLLQGFIKDGVKDYMLYCFLGLANKNVGNKKAGFDFYRQAVELDDAKPIAWKEAYKILESNEDEENFANDDFSVDVFKKMLYLSENDGKVNELYYKFLVNNKKWNEIMENWRTDTDILKRIVKSFEVQDNYNYSELELKLLSRSFSDLKQKNSINGDEEIFRNYCRFLLKTESEELIENLIEFVNTYNSPDDHWMKKELFNFICETFFVSHTIPESFENLIAGYIFEKSSEILECLRDNDTTSALEILDSLPPSAMQSYPYCLLFVNLLAEGENWSSCKKVVEFARNCSKNRDVVAFCTGWLARVAVEEHENIEVDIAKLPLPEFIEEKVKICEIQGNAEEVKRIFDNFGTESEHGCIARLVSELYGGRLNKESLVLVEKLLKFGEPDWRDVLLAAEVKIALNSDGTSLLVKAAKLNPRSSRVFYVLGKSLAQKNPIKARSCLERAVKVQQGNEEYVRELDKLLKKQNASNAERLQHLKKLASLRKSQKSTWLSEEISALYLEAGNFDEAIDELQQIVRKDVSNKMAWARLAQAYFKKGHLRAAVSSYEHLSQLEGCRVYMIPMIQVLVQLKDFDVALEKIEELGNVDEKFSKAANNSMDILEAQIRLNFLGTTCGEDRKNHLKLIFKALQRCFSYNSTNFSILYKLTGDSLLQASEYSEKCLKTFEINEEWRIEDRLACVKTAASFYSIVLRCRRNDAMAWFDMAVTLLKIYKIEENLDTLRRAECLITHALSLTTDAFLLSSLWALLADVLRLLKSHPNQQLHCLTRALQLNKANDGAWLKLAVLCMLQNELVMAGKALEQCLKYNPLNADGWCAWAQHAHLNANSYEALMMSRQALCHKPTVSSVVVYCTHLCDSLKKNKRRFESTTAALEFETLLELKDRANCDDATMYCLAVLANLFGYYNEAAECYEIANYDGDDLNSVKLKLKIINPESATRFNPSKSLSSSCIRQESLLDYSISDLKCLLTTEVELYAKLFSLIEVGNIEEFKTFYTENFKNISVPLLIAGLIALEIDLSIEIVSIIHEALPRHELIDYFPTILPAGIDNGLQHLEQDGEPPFRYKHHVAQDVLQELKALRTVYESLQDNVS